MSSTATDQQSTHTPAALIAFAWALVGVPLAVRAVPDREDGGHPLHRLTARRWALSVAGSAPQRLSGRSGR